MPPWYIDKNIGVQGFKYDYSLTDAEIDTIEQWVDIGSPRGNPADLPPARQFRDIAEWRIGEPDWIVEIPEPFVVAAEAPNWWGDLVSASGLTEDRWIKAVETKPSLEGFPVVHHAVTSMSDPDSDDDDYNFLNEYALGKNGDIFPEGTGRLIKAGSQIKFNMHYAANGVETTDRTRVGIQFYPKGVVPDREFISAHVGDDEDLDIPAGASNVRHDGFYRLKENAHHHRVPGPSAQPWQETVSGCGPSGQLQADPQLCRLGFWLAYRLQLRGRRRPAAAQGHHAARHELARQLRRQPVERRPDQLGRVWAAVKR